MIKSDWEDWVIVTTVMTIKCETYKWLDRARGQMDNLKAVCSHMHYSSIPWKYNTTISDTLGKYIINPFASGIPKVLLSPITGLFSVKIR